MGRWLFILLFLIQAELCFAQMQQSNDIAAKFMRYYNTGKPDSLNTLYADGYAARHKAMWDSTLLVNDKQVTGNITTCQLWSENMEGISPVTYLVVLFERRNADSARYFGIYLDKQNRITEFEWVHGWQLSKNANASNNEHWRRIYNVDGPGRRGKYRKR